MSQPTIQQIEHKIARIEARIQERTLEHVSYSQLRDCSANFINRLLYGALQLRPRDEEATKPIRDALVNFFTAKMNSTALDISGFETELAMWKQMASGIVVGVGSIPNNFKI